MKKQKNVYHIYIKMNNKQKDNNMNNNIKKSSTKDLSVGIWDISKWDECVWG